MTTPSRNGTGKHTANGHANGSPSLTTVDNDGSRDLATGHFGPGNRLGRQFEPGNQCARGNPSLRKLAAARRAFLQAVGPEEVQALARRLYQDALAGDNDAARLVLAYAVGKPGQAPDPDRGALDELRLAAKWPGAELALAAILGHLNPVEAVSRATEGYQRHNLLKLLEELLGPGHG